MCNAHDSRKNIAKTEHKVIVILKHMLCVDFCRNDLEVTDDFVKQFNEARDPSDRQKLRRLSKKMLERIKVVFCMLRVCLFRL